MFQAKDPDALRKWYPEHLGIAVMVNYRVADLHALVRELRTEGCNVLAKTEESLYGKFGRVIDPAGNKVEHCEPPGPMSKRPACSPNPTEDASCLS